MHDKAPPRGWPRLSSAVFYDDAAAAIDWLTRVFGVDTRVRVDGPDGRVVHSQLTFGEGMVMISQVGLQGGANHSCPRKSPRGAGGANTQSVMLCVDDVDAHCERARAGGAKILIEPATQDYGPDYWSDRTYLAEDPEGHQWWFLQRLREAPEAR
ncbi:MAG: VOC family protein [Planctomycetes bacterium]|nr:VOC family protein [Planctomycetota bacterium]